MFVFMLASSENQTLQFALNGSRMSYNRDQTHSVFGKVLVYAGLKKICL